MIKNVAVDSTAEAYLELLAARGIDYFFGNGGTDFGPIIEAYAKRLEAEAVVPQPITVPHEATAMAMAHGYTNVTGKPQVVMVHTIPGTANAVGGLINANRSQIPMLFSAGRTPLTEGQQTASRDGAIHWPQESFDQGSMVREWVKWDYELRAGADLEGVVDRALAIAQSEPQGPVYLTLPREVLAAKVGEFTYSDRPRMTAGEMVAAPAAIAAAAAAIAGAKNPIAITRSVGKDPGAVAPLVALAEALGMAVFEPGPVFANFPQDHPLHAGADAGSALAEADVVLLLEADVPWMPKQHAVPHETTVITIGSDPLFSKYPVRGFPSDISLAGKPRLTLQALADAVQQEGVDPAARSSRQQRWAASHQRLREALRGQALKGKEQRPIDKAWFSHCVEEVRDADTVVVNELCLDMTQLCLTTQGSFYGVSTAGNLGWGVGAALGTKLAAPDKTVICGVGDGSYIFGSPEAGHWVARAYDLPVLFLVFNNSGWNAVARATQNVYPEGYAVKTRRGPFTDLAPALDFEHIIESAGGYGEQVTDPADLPNALQRGLRVVKEEKRQALLNVVGFRP